MSCLIKKNNIVLFQGDSITDAGRNRENTDDLGYGYAAIASSLFSAAKPEKNVKFYNRGISGNRVIDLKDRWKKDCIDLKPDVLSILIGINDCWRRYDNNEATSIDDFESVYHDLLNEVKSKLPETKIIICEPFVLPIPLDRIKWREDLDPKIQASRRLAVEFKTLYIPFDSIFAIAGIKAPLQFWAPDGVHPTLPGHALMAKEWLKYIKS